MDCLRTLRLAHLAGFRAHAGLDPAGMKCITSGEGEMFREICRGGRRAIGYRDRLKTAAQSTDDNAKHLRKPERLLTDVIPGTWRARVAMKWIKTMTRLLIAES